ncbi:receptor-like protein 9b isoform X1 [Solanum dulcamara]|uniref:receptor-like protein 9b isoform X1 n=1 Tax=Solanum dulcamara TaxID=45834 RepID=UPI002485CD84|nr:receptor-like protein 9b isoform X1 [Solanum dulcamara]
MGMWNSKFLLLMFFVMVIVANGCWEEERSALLELQANRMSSNGELLVDWAGYNANGFTDCCFWNRVKCSLASGRVIELNLETRLGSEDGWRFNASFFLPFKSLQVLLLSSRNIIGWTKNEGFSKLRKLPNLKVVDLQFNPIHPKVLISSLCWISSLEVLKLGAHVGTTFSIPTCLESIPQPSHRKNTKYLLQSTGNREFRPFPQQIEWEHSCWST